MRALIVLPVFLFLAACGPNGEPTVENGGCKIIDQPDVPICGLTAEDQRWLDVNLARYGAACHWQRRQGEPCKRPVLPPVSTPAPKKKPLMGWLRRKG